MSETVAFTFIASGTMLGFMLGYIVALKRGREEGRDQQWMDDFFTRIEKEKQRRDKLGRFKKTQIANRQS